MGFCVSDGWVRGEERGGEPGAAKLTDRAAQGRSGRMLLEARRKEALLFSDALLPSAS